MSKLIIQEFDSSCGVACLAMWLGKTHEEIRLKYFPDHEFEHFGIPVHCLQEVLSDHGMKTALLDKWLFSLKGILFVSSLNVKGGLHFMYWDGPGKLYDPNTGYKDKKIHTIPGLRVEHMLVDSSEERAQGYMKRKIKEYQELVTD